MNVEQAFKVHEDIQDEYKLFLESGSDTTIRSFEFFEIHSRYNKDTEEWESGFYKNDTFWSLANCMKIEHPYFHGHIGLTNTSAYLVRLVDCYDSVIVSMVY